MPKIHIENIGPIEDATFRIESPGLYVIEGAPGVGKTTAIRTIQLMVDGRCDVKPTKRDGASRGLVELGGKTMRVSKTTRMEGELAIEGLGDLSIADLHTPRFQEARTRDMHRIKTLVRLAEVKADPELFYPLLGGKADFRDLVSSRRIDTDDLLEMAGIVKSEIEVECRQVEKQAANARESAKVKLAQAEGIDLDAPHDERELADQWQRATSAHAAIKERREAYLRTQRAAESARSRLAELPPGKSVAEANAEHSEACKVQLDAQEEVERLEERLKDARASLRLAESKALAAYQALERAESEVAIRGELDKAIEAAAGTREVTEDEVDEAAEKVGAARRANETGMKVRMALKAEEDARVENERAKRLEKRAEFLRAASAGTMDVLTDAIARIEDCPLRVKTDDDGNPRLVIATDRSDREYFEDLSGGEKWDVVMRIATRNNRLIPFPQEAFGELAPSLRNQLHETAKAHGAYVITALATDGELAGVPYDEKRHGSVRIGAEVAE